MNLVVSVFSAIDLASAEVQGQSRQCAVLRGRGTRPRADPQENGGPADRVYGSSVPISQGVSAMWKKWGLCLCFSLSLAPWTSAQAEGPAINEVWMQRGGARLYYDALMEPQQMELKGARRKDPALMRNLPPITEVKPQISRRKSTRPATSGSKAGQVAATPDQVKSVQIKSTQTSPGLPAGQSTSPRPKVEGAPAAPSAPTTSGASGARGTPVRGNGGQGSLLPTPNDVFVPPPTMSAIPAIPGGGAGPGSATSGASTSATTATGAGNTSVTSVR